MGEKKGGAKVPDWLRSIDFGICYGPVDHLNKLWIKDKSVLCGNYDSRVNIPVDQPELFGGDDKEGGVKGTAEFYPGTDDQVASSTLASKVGRTPGTMPAYRGIAHLFLRGKGGEGWRWGTNNPYMPSAKVSVTRIPRTLGSTHARIFPVTGVSGPEATPVSAENSWVTFTTGFPARGPVIDINPTLEFHDTTTNSTAPFPWTIWRNGGNTAVQAGQEPQNDRWWLGNGGFGRGQLARDFHVVDDFGASVEAIDAGEARVRVTYVATDEGLFDTWQALLGAYDGEGNALGGVQMQGEVDAEPWPGSTSVAYSSELPEGTRWVRIGADSQRVKVYPGDTWIEWNEAQANYCDPDDEGLRLLPNANPAHIVHETMVNQEWGKGEDPTRIDTASFTAAAELFHGEFFGLSFAWVRQGSVEDFIQQVLDHTSSMLFIHPRTGLWTLKPLRGDYDAASARLLDPSNCTAKKRKRRAWGETINEIVVKYKDPQTEEDATVVAHNLANIAIQGGVISETRNYQGIRDKWLAERVAQRDVVEAGHPLYSAEVEADRSFWDVVPGDVLRFSWPEDGIEEMVVRVMKVDYGSPTSRVIKMSIAEDVFSLEHTTYGEVQGSEWDSERRAPEPLEAEMAMAVPLPMGLRSGITLAEVDSNYPAVGVMLLGSDDDGQTVDIQAHGPVTRNDGSETIDAVTNVNPARSVLLDAALAEEAVSTLPGSPVASLTLSGAEQGDLLLLGDSEANQEIVMLGAYNAAADTWTLWRGIYDTVPAEWSAGTRLWVLPEPPGQIDPTERAGGEEITYRLLPRTVDGRLNYEDGADLTYTVTERPHLPFRPANVQIDGNGFGIAAWTSPGPTFPITVTWANRHRATEDTVAMKWTEGNVTPESGQTTVIRVFDDSDVLAGEITGLTGTSYAMSEADFQGVTYGYLEFVSERDGLRSRPGARRWFDMRFGYGYGYGLDYGR